MSDQGLQNTSTKETALVVNETTSLLGVIERAAKDPSVDMDKMERLLQMHERITAKQAEAAFNYAMTKCQEAMRRVSADATNPQTHSKYASYGKLDSVLRPIYTSHGFSLTFSDGETIKPEHVRVVCLVRHIGGYKEVHWKDMPADGKGAKGGDVMTKTHAAGAAQQYGMRYLLKGIFNVAIGEDDNDGNDDVVYINENQVADLRSLLEEVKADTSTFCKFFKIESIEKLPAKAYPYAVSMAEAKRKKPRKENADPGV